MWNALTCIPDNVSTDDAGDLFGIVCGLGSGTCDGIDANSTSGKYGAYGMCNSTQQLGWALNDYYEQEVAAGNGASACDFSGSAKTKAVTSPTGTCATLISQAGSGGTGTVTSSPSGTGSSGSSGSSGSGSSSSTSKSAGAAGFSAPAHIGFLQVAFYVSVALVSGAGMILL